MTKSRDLADLPAGSGDINIDDGTLFVDASTNRVGIGTTSPAQTLHLDSNSASTYIQMENSTQNEGYIGYLSNGSLTFWTDSASQAMTIDSSGNLLVGCTTFPGTSTGVEGGWIGSDGSGSFSRDGQIPLYVTRAQDGPLVYFYSATSVEGSISVSGSTVSYNGGHLARWSRLADDSKDTSIVKGTVMTNLDAMVEWGDEENEQLNKMAVSSIEGDANVAGVFVNWDEDDDWNDVNIAMTGDMVIRIAQGTTVERGDLLMSAGDGTAKPQGDDIVRSKTIAKVTSTHVSHTYDDGSYLVPCVLMAC